MARARAKVVLLEAPTGSGKTLLMAALGKLLKSQVLYTCHTKGLQEQVLGDFPYGVELKGRANYPCLKSPVLLTANECTGKKDCPHKLACPYLVQKAMARASELAILNIPYFLAEANFLNCLLGAFQSFNLAGSNGFPISRYNNCVRNF